MRDGTGKARATRLGWVAAAGGAALLLLNLVSGEPSARAFPCELWQGMGAEDKRATVHEQLVAPRAGAERGCLERNVDRFVEATDGFCRDTAGSTFGSPEIHTIALEAERRKACR